MSENTQKSINTNTQNKTDSDEALYLKEFDNTNNQINSISENIEQGNEIRDNDSNSVKDLNNSTNASDKQKNKTDLEKFKEKISPDFKNDISADIKKNDNEKNSNIKSNQNVNEQKQILDNKNEIDNKNDLNKGKENNKNMEINNNNNSSNNINNSNHINEGKDNNTLKNNSNINSNNKENDKNNKNVNNIENNEKNININNENNKSKIISNNNENNVNNSDNNNNINSNNNNINNNNEKKIDHNNNNNNNEINNNINNSDNNNNINIIPNSNNNDNKNKPSSNNNKPIKTGLINLGDTSYLNAVLQLLGNIGKLASYFLDESNQNYIKNNIKKLPLSFVISRLYIHLYSIKQIGEKYKPDSIMRVLGYLNIVYKSIKRRNPNELISFILNTLHNELNTLKNNNQEFNPNIYSKENVIQYGIQNFEKNNKSIISDILNWFEIKEIKCTKCNKTMYNFNSFNTFELDISGCYQSNNNNPITLNDCIKYENITKNKNLFCKNCNINTQMSIFSKIYNSSRILIFSLNRGNLQNNNLLNIKFNLEHNINISLLIEHTNLLKNYELIGIVSITKKDNNYVYVAFCKSKSESKHWYLYDDENAVYIDLKHILKVHGSFQYIPCLLAYREIDTKKE